MPRKIKSVVGKSHRSRAVSFEYLDVTKANEVMNYHKSFSEYKRTPLANLENLASYLGVGGLYVKDESQRFGLNAFKVLGGSYAIGQVLAKRLGLSNQELNFSILTSPKVREALGELTFVTATDGNHGRGVAWTAAALGLKSVVYMPKGSSCERLENIRHEGALAEITELNYDDAVRYARQMAEEKGWILVQDTAWEGYSEIPTWIMQGYMTMAYEAYRAMEKEQKKPTHIVLQAGVGSMAAAVAGFLAQIYKENRPKVIVVEPARADCFYRTALANDGRLHCVTDDMNTIMAGLACGEPNPMAWAVLDICADAFLSCTDELSAKGMRILGNPVGDDPRVISGESGAVGVGALAEILLQPEQNQLKEQLGLDHQSHILFFSTEGDTDRAGYRDIVWEGKYPSYKK